MQIQKVSYLPLTARYTQNKPAKNCRTTNSNSMPYLTQFAYRDYGISFAGQINRSPANFYEFNKKNLPDTMKEYLNADYEDRQNMPPAQMMKLVYGDLNEINSLDFVPRLFPDEPLFADLTDRPKRNARKGLVSEFEALRDEMKDEPLFKDGSSNLGMYLLRKIYLEGKQRKEINKDFYNDLSDTYKGLITSPVDYSTFSAYGIKFPKTPFWNSFVVTRDDWNYVYKPRKAFERSGISQKHELSFEDLKKESIQQKIPPKFKLNDFEVDKMTDAIVDGSGSLDVARKNLKRKGIKDPEKLTFVSKYFGEIMSVALEKIHASDEMKDFFANYDSLNKKQREKFNAYWHSNSQMRTLQSIAVSDTIKLFFEAYGADGNNEEFRDLLNYAASIKPEREARKAEHDRIQAEYEELFAQLDDEQEVQEKPLVPLSQEKLNEMLKEEAIKGGAEVFEFVSPEGDHYSCVCNVDEVFTRNLKAETLLLPSSFVNKYTRFMLSSPLATPEYKKSIALMVDVPDFAKEQLMQPDDYRKISANINREFGLKFPKIMLADEQALAVRILDRLGFPPKYSMMIAFDAQKLMNFAADTLKIKDWTPEERAKLDKDYQSYLAPLKDKKEINKINEDLVNYFSKVDLNAPCDTEDEFYDDLIKLTAANMQRYPQVKGMISKLIRQTKYLEEYGGSARLLSQDNIPESVKDIKRRLMIEDLIARNSQDLIPVFALSSVNAKKYVHDESLASMLVAKAVRLHGNFFN